MDGEETIDKEDIAIGFGIKDGSDDADVDPIIDEVVDDPVEDPFDKAFAKDGEEFSNEEDPDATEMSEYIYGELGYEER